MQRPHRWLMLALVTSALFVASALAAGTAAASVSKETSCHLNPTTNDGKTFVWSKAGNAQSGASKTVQLSKQFLGGPSEPGGFSVAASPKLVADPLPLDGSPWSLKFHVKGEWRTQLPATSNVFDDRLDMFMGLTVGDQAFSIGNASIPLHEPGLPSSDQLLNTPFDYSFDTWLAFEFSPKSTEGGTFNELGIDYKLGIVSPGFSATSGELTFTVFMDETHALFVPAPCSTVADKAGTIDAGLGKGTNSSPLWGAAVVTVAIGVAGVTFFRSRPPA